jgi:hypothetical protein
MVLMPPVHDGSSGVQRHVAFEPVWIEHARGREAESLGLEDAEHLRAIHAIAKVNIDQHLGIGRQMLFENRDEFRTARLIQVDEFVQAPGEGGLGEGLTNWQA